MPSMSTEAKRMGYIMKPPFSKVESSFPDPSVSAAKAELTRPGYHPANKLNNPILIGRLIMFSILMRSPSKRWKYC